MLVLLNLIVIPLVPVVFLSGAAGMLAGGASVAAGMFLAGASAGVLRFFQTLLERTEVLPGSRAVIGQPELWQIALYYVLVGAAVWGGKRKEKREKSRENKKAMGSEEGANYENAREQEVRIEKSGQSIPMASSQKHRHMLLRTAGIIFALCMLCFPFHRPVEVTFLDVGQGDAVFLRTEAGTTCLIDGGSTTVSDVGTYRLLPFLKSRGVSSLDYLFLSHMDADHINGAEELLKDQFRGIPIRHLQVCQHFRGMRPGNRWTKKPASLVQNFVTSAAGRFFGNKWAEIRCLSPVKDQKKEDENENSEVLMVEISGLRILFTGDLGEEGEQELLKAGTDLRAAVLKVGHHGSRFSTGEDFLVGSFSGDLL